jgi:hypothetical protein
MSQQSEVSKTPLLVAVTGGILICFGILLTLFFILGILAGGLSLGYASGILLIIIGWGIVKMRKWSIYVLGIILLGSIFYLIQGLNKGQLSVEIFVQPIVTLFATLYCWSKRKLFL